jgi:hypothetical protein
VGLLKEEEEEEDATETTSTCVKRVTAPRLDCKGTLGKGGVGWTRLLRVGDRRRRMKAGNERRLGFRLPYNVESDVAVL